MRRLHGRYMIAGVSKIHDDVPQRASTVTKPACAVVKQASSRSHRESALKPLQTRLTFLQKAVAMQLRQTLCSHSSFLVQSIHVRGRHKLKEPLAPQSGNCHMCSAWLKRQGIQLQIADDFAFQLLCPNTMRALSDRNTNSDCRGIGNGRIP